MQQVPQQASDWLVIWSIWVFGTRLLLSGWLLRRAMLHQDTI
jgi:hydrogenase-4 membrane subunit HyfE